MILETILAFLAGLAGGVAGGLLGVWLAWRSVHAEVVERMTLRAMQQQNSRDQRILRPGDSK